MPDALTLANAALEIEALSVAYPSRGGWLQALDGVSLSIPPGGVLGLVGESGSGKSTVVLALLGLLGPSARVTAQRLAVLRAVSGGGFRHRPIKASRIPADGGPWKTGRGPRPTAEREQFRHPVLKCHDLS